MFSGAIQRTDRLVALPSTVGASGARGGSSTSVAFTVTSIVAVPPSPSSAFTVNVWLAFDSWSRSALVRSCPVLESMPNEPASGPSSV